MAFGKKFVIFDTTARTLTDFGTTLEYVEVIEDDTTFAVYTPDGQTTLCETTGDQNKLADASNAANRKKFPTGFVIKIPCKALTLATGAVIGHTSPVE